MKTVKYFLVFVLSFPVYAMEFSQHIGKWKSNEQMTLQSMNGKKNIPEKMVKLFTKDFFGKLIIEIKEETVSSYFVDDNEWKQENLPYTKKVLSPNSIFISYTDKETDIKLEYEYIFENNCFYTLVSKFQFREYFCRVVE